MRAIWTRILTFFLAATTLGASSLCNCASAAAAPAPATAPSTPSHACCAKGHQAPASQPTAPSHHHSESCRQCRHQQQADRLTPTSSDHASVLAHGLVALLPMHSDMTVAPLALSPAPHSSPTDTEPILLQDLFHRACLLTI